MDRSQYKLSQWFCVHTKPAHEVQAVLSLKDLSSEIQDNIGELEIYFPQIRAKMSVAGHLRQVMRPLFPRYFFAKFIWEKASRFVGSRPQVLGLVQFGDMPAIVSSEVIEDLVSWSLGTDDEVFDPMAHLSPGQRVLIKSGLFKGVEAEFLSHLSDQKRVALLLNHLQSQTRLILDRSHLRLVS
jgi:transcriptional antiterminator RfaH